MPKSGESDVRAPIRVGAVSYLNARPLVACLPEIAPHAQMTVDVPSRLADWLQQGGLDVALIPTIEYFRMPEAAIVSDACVACRGPVRSVKLYGRKPVWGIQTVALDEGSRTSAAITRILLRERYGLEPQFCSLPIGASADDTDADAVMLIGDRGMLAPPGEFAFVWDLGEEWVRWTGLPFVFAMWVARAGVDLRGFHTVLAAARDEGQRRLPQIARLEAASVGISEEDCLVYLRDHLVFRLGPRERLGVETFGRLAAAHGLAQHGVPLVFYHGRAA